jgi:hypothetical protein
MVKVVDCKVQSVNFMSQGGGEEGGGWNIVSKKGKPFDHN